ncbi:MAG: phenylalanine--tRNA ligase subunit beta [Methanobacteriaceae archaeon]|nr:phenylalanine--tRNA ligase subunit beta [Methanobacteriaceae archaeon]
MPVITFDYEDLYQVLETEISPKKLIELLPMIGSDIEDYDEKTIRVEFFPNRPDHFSVEGIARTLKGFLEIETGLPQYEITNSGMEVEVDPDLEEIRPYIGFCVAEGVNLNENKLKQIMEFQEDLHWVIGRDRKKVAIGIHNLDVIEPPFSYRAADPNGETFIPLDSVEEMSLKEILQEHKKGVEYAHLIHDHNQYPLIVDSNNEVLSMPPIINGELTKLTEDTKNVLIDVTGTDEKAVNHALNIIASSFAEAGAQIKSLEIKYHDRNVTTPNFMPKKKLVSVEDARKIIGVDIDEESIVNMLERVRLGAINTKMGEIEVSIPPYRIDILHQVDIIENIAIGYCFNKIKPMMPEISTVGKENKWDAFDSILREILIGLGFNEIMSLMLTNEKMHYANLNLEEDERVQVAQPISVERTMIRKSLLNGLMEFLENNKHEELPQKIFEIGDTVFIDNTKETHIRMVKKLSGAVTHSSANFTEIKSIIDSIISNLGLEMEIDVYDHPSFINGRCALVNGINKSKGETQLKGFFGEINPEVITNFNLEYPVVAFEIEFT